MASKKSNKEFIKEIYDLVGSEYIFLESYKNNKDPLLCRHVKCGHEWKIKPNNFISLENRCPICSVKNKNVGKKTNKEFLNEVMDQVGNEYTFLEKYMGNKIHLLCRHNKCGNEWKIKPNVFLNLKRRCPKCAINKRPQCSKKSNEEFLRNVRDQVGNEYTFLEEYNGNLFKILCRHNECGHEYKVRPLNFLRSNPDRCPKCYGTPKRNNNEFLKEIKNHVGDEYTFLEEYNGTHFKILCRHEKCNHEFKVTPNNFIQSGTRCPKCFGSPKKSNKEFIKEVYDLVGDEYTFLEKYVNANIKLKVVHNKCGYKYDVKPSDFLKLNGNRCPKCYGSPKKSNEEFIKKVHDLVGDEYTFLEEYVNNKTKLRLIHNKCKLQYSVKPMYFVRGSRCPECSFTGSSRSEKCVLKFIKKVYNGIIIENDKKILDGKEIDIYLPDLKIGIEYCGLYWHSELYKDNSYHLDKLNKCHEKGIKLIQIFEDEWVSNKKIIKSKIKHILGLNSKKEKIYARKCTIKEIDTGIKNEFLDKYHIQGKDISKIKLGLFYDERLVSVMTFSKPRSCLGNKKSDTNSYELSRFTTKRKYNVVGGFSKLLSYFKKNYEFSSIITYADLRYSSLEGNLYEVNGFKLSHQSKPNYWYIKKSGSYIKFHRYNFRKGNLKKLFPEIYDDNLTEHEIMLKAKYLRIYDCGTLVYKLM